MCNISLQIALVFPKNNEDASDDPYVHLNCCFFLHFQTNNNKSTSPEDEESIAERISILHWIEGIGGTFWKNGCKHEIDIFRYKIWKSGRGIRSSFCQKKVFLVFLGTYYPRIHVWNCIYSQTVNCVLILFYIKLSDKHLDLIDVNLIYWLYLGANLPSTLIYSNKIAGY